MWSKNWNRFIDFIFFMAFTAVLVGCGKNEGIAPSHAVTPTVPSTNWNILLKNAQSKTTPGGWEIVMDNADPVETKPLGNGWTAEVRYE